MSRFVLTPAAEGDLLKIIEYLEGDSPDAVLRVVDALDEAMQRLADNPAIGHVRPDLTDQDVRFWPVFKYLVVYRPETNPLEIVRVLHLLKLVARGRSQWIAAERLSASLLADCR